MHTERRSGRHYWRVLSASVTLAPWLLGACSSTETTDPDTTPTSISIVSGDSQTGDTDTQLGAALVVVVRNAAGDGLSGKTVQWSVTAGGGMLASATSTTGNSGQASNTYTLGSTAGTNTITAAVSGASLSTDFTATATMPDLVPASIEIGSGNNQSVGIATELPEPLVVVVKNAGGNPLTDVTVDWSVTSGGGSLGSPSSTTSGSGQASNTFTVASTPGSSTIDAAVQSNPTLSVQFTATATSTSASAVSVQDNEFDPDAVGVDVNGTVTWTWGGTNLHNVTFVAGGLSNSATQSSGTHSVTFTQSGTYQYYCSIHGTANTGMRGTVTVP